MTELSNMMRGCVIGLVASALLGACRGPEPGPRTSTGGLPGHYCLEIYGAQDLVRKIGDSHEHEWESPGGALEADQLQTIVSRATGEGAWDDPASTEIHRGQLVVNQTRELHEMIFTRATEGDPSDQVIRQYLLQAQLLVGDRVPDFKPLEVRLPR